MIHTTAETLETLAQVLSNMSGSTVTWDASAHALRGTTPAARAMLGLAIYGLRGAVLPWNAFGEDDLLNTTEVDVVSMILDGDITVRDHEAVPMNVLIFAPYEKE